MKTNYWILEKQTPPQKVQKEILAINQPLPYNSSNTHLIELLSPSPTSHNQVFKLLVSAEIQNKTVGFMFLRCCFEDADIDFIGIKQEEQKKGIGSFILDEALLILNSLKIERVLLEVGEQNTPAKSLYEKKGFIKTGVRKKYYKNNEDALIMEKVLK